MAKSNRDRRRRPRSGKCCPEAQSGAGCNFCVTGDYKRAASRSRRRGNRIEARAALHSAY